jgi:hypothetical protein
VKIGNFIHYSILISLLLLASKVSSQNTSGKRETFTVSITVSDSLSGEKIVGAPCQIKGQGIFAVTDGNGLAVFQNLRKGEIKIDVSYLGYESCSRTLQVSSDLTLKIKIVETTLQLKEVTVVAKSSAAGSSTASQIGRQAIDHLQATNLGDIMQLLPGATMQTPDLTVANSLQIRSASNATDKNNSFGASIIVDGVPVSNNANIESALGGNNNTAGKGVDLRQISADNIESVEVIRGIPSAEYGDLTSGAVIVKSKSGRTPYEIRTKVNPTTINTSFGKGFAFGKKFGFLNTNFNYVQAWSDPRKKTESFDRYSFSLNYGNTFFKKWKTNTKFNFSGLIDWNGADPDAIAEGIEQKQTNNSFKFSHEGKIALNLPVMRTLSYVIGFSNLQSESKSSAKIESPRGFLPILTAMQTGYYDVPFDTVSYYASGGVKSNPQDLFAKVSNSFGFKLLKNWTHQIGMGVEYRYEHNKAQGYYNDNEAHPLKPTSNGRPRPYYDIPPISQFSGYLEDKMTWKTFGLKTNLTAGLRYNIIQPGKEEQVSALSPRINASISLTKDIELRAGFGQSAKTPGLTHLYPDKSYNDRVAYKDISNTNINERIAIYNTNVYTVQRSVGLKNAVNTKYEIGIDIKLPNDRSISIIGYQDVTPNGFGNFSQYYTYLADVYKIGYGLKANPGSKPTFDNTTSPLRVDTVYQTKGMFGNTQWAQNRGVELDADLGKIESWNTSLYFSGAFIESSYKTSGTVNGSPKNFGGNYVDAQTPPFLYKYQSGLEVNINRTFNTTFRAVTHIPALRMVLSNAIYVTWYTYKYDSNQIQYPIGYIFANQSGGVDEIEITDAMRADPNYRFKGYLLSDGKIDNTDKIPTINSTPIWNLSTRLTKEISKVAGFSFYVNNTLFYEPWVASSVTKTLSQRNVGTFSFGMELFFKL